MDQTIKLERQKKEIENKIQDAQKEMLQLQIQHQNTQFNINAIDLLRDHNRFEDILSKYTEIQITDRSIDNYISLLDSNHIICNVEDCVGRIFYKVSNSMIDTKLAFFDIHYRKLSTKGVNYLHRSELKKHLQKLIDRRCLKVYKDDQLLAEIESKR